jgi:hypothetical protein
LIQEFIIEEYLPFTKARDSPIARIQEFIAFKLFFEPDLRAKNVTTPELQQWDILPKKDD